MMYRVIDLPDDEVDSWRSEWNRKVRVEERRFLKYEVSEESVCLFVGYQGQLVGELSFRLLIENSLRDKS